MSNLTLPKMTYDTLRGMLANARLKGKHRVSIAYETTIEFSSMQDQTIVVRHRGNPIAEIGKDFFTLDNAGWHSVTTANRLNQILKDNQTTLPTDPAVTDRLWYFVHVKDGEMLLSGRPVEGKPRKLRSFYSSVAHFSRVDSDHHYALQGGDEYL